MLVGEAGIGKTRTAEELAAIARQEGLLVWWGACHEGEWAPPYGPFAEAMTDYTRGVDAAQLRRDLGFGSGPIARLVPALHERLSDIREPAALQPDEERFRLLDAVRQLLTATSMRVPLLLVLDDIHWADQGTIAMLRHLARAVPRHRILLLATCRDLELDQAPALADGLAALRREANCERILLKGLQPDDVGELLGSLAEAGVTDRLVTAITEETGGNPFFVREVLFHLLEEGKLVQEAGGWTLSLAFEPIGVPEGVRQVIERRLSRVDGRTHRLLTVAAAFGGVFRADIAAAVDGLDEVQGLDAVEEALRAQVLRATGLPATYDFAHALIRHTLYAAQCPSRRARLHREIAETMDRVFGERVAEHASEIAYQYFRSAALPGAERGVVHALVAADRAEAAYAWEQVVTYLRMALALLPQGDARYPRVLARLGLALPWVFAFDESVQVADEAGRLLAEAEGPEAAADYLGEATSVLGPAGSLASAMQLARRGMQYIDGRRDLTWLRLASHDLQRREQEDPAYPGLPLETRERRELADVALSLPLEQRRGILNVFPALVSREQAVSQWAAFPVVQTLCAGNLRAALPCWEERAEREEREGRVDTAATWQAYVARCRLALGELAAAQEAYERGAVLSSRLPGVGNAACHLSFYAFERCLAADEGWAEHADEACALTAQAGAWSLVYAAVRRANAAVVAARMGETDRALELVASLAEPLERAPAWSPHYTAVACGAATALWMSERTDHIAVIESSLRDKVLAPDFRYPMRDGRLSMACLCVLQGHYGRASECFAQARVILDQQGARPLRAMVDYEEGSAYLRRAAPGDRERAERLLDAAARQFRALAMTGWIRRTENLHRDAGPGLRLVQRPPDASAACEAEIAAPRPQHEPPGNVFRKEGEYWTLAYEGRIARLKDAKGLHYIAHLVRHPGRGFHVRELVALVEALQTSCMAPAELGVRVNGWSDAGPILDARAKAAYKGRLDDLRDDLEEAERFNDQGRATRARDEIEVLTDQLAAAVGLGGRDRHAASDAERARLAVTKRIRAALEKIRHADPTIADHLTAAISTGYFCTYEPRANTLASWLS